MAMLYIPTKFGAYSLIHSIDINIFLNSIWWEVKCRWTCLFCRHCSWM